jgi:hypothetical protein
MERKTILYIVRSEADFERVVCLAIAGKEKFEQSFIFAGDFSPYFNDGILNTFQKELFNSFGFIVRDVHDFGAVGKFNKWLGKGLYHNYRQVRKSLRQKFIWLVNKFLFRILESRKSIYVDRVVKQISPDYLFTDQSITDDEYLPQMFRSQAIALGIPVYLFSHGAAGGLHGEFSGFVIDPYPDCTVLACSTKEPNSNERNRIIIGDVSSSYPYVRFLNSLDIGEIDFLNSRKHKIGLIVGGTIFTSTNGWHTMLEIIINHSENPDVAMVLKLHPREAPFIDLRMLNNFDNLRIIDRETDRSRISKWADIVICSDHCSTIFEPMILGKKVLALEGIHTPSYASIHSPLRESSVSYITSVEDFEIENIQPANPTDQVTDEVAWGGHGTIDLAERIINKIIETV